MTVGTRGRPSFPWRREPIPAAPGSRFRGNDGGAGVFLRGNDGNAKYWFDAGMTVGTRGRS